MVPMTTSAKEHSELIFKADKIRMHHDIRFKKETELTRYQKMQLKEVERQTRELELRELRLKIFRTFDFSWEEKEEINEVEPTTFIMSEIEEEMI